MLKGRDGGFTPKPPGYFWTKEGSGISARILGLSMDAVFGRVVIYTRKMEEMISFYGNHFGFEVLRDPADRIVELQHPEGGGVINLHPAAKSQKMGQVLIKLVFDVEDVETFVTAHPGFGPIHHVPGYSFANSKDPSGNSVSVSSRAFATKKG